MNPPNNIPLITGEIADYYYDQPSGILYSYSKSILRTVYTPPWPWFPNPAWQS